MKPKTLILLGIAIGCGLLASYMTSRVIADRSQTQEVSKVPVVFATKNIPSGFMVKNPDEFFVVRMIPDDIAPRGKVIRDVAELKDKRVINPVGADKHVSLEDLLGNNEMGLTWKIPEGMRAASVKVTQDMSVAGFVLPGMHVDILCMPNGKNECNVILQRVLVLAVNQLDMAEREKKSIETHSVTFAVSPDDGNKLALASHSGHLKFTLRHGNDDKITTTRGARADDLTRTSEATEVVPTDGTGTQPIPVQALPVNPTLVQTDPTAVVETRKVEPAQPKVIWQMKIGNGPRVEVVKFYDEPLIDVEKTEPEAEAPTPKASKKDTKPEAGSAERKDEESPKQPAKDQDGKE